MFYEYELMIILKSTKMRELTFTLGYTFSEKTDEEGGGGGGGGGGEQIDSPVAFLGLNSNIKNKWQIFCGNMEDILKC